jgi:hypothetical protein
MVIAVYGRAEYFLPATLRSTESVVAGAAPFDLTNKVDAAYVGHTQCRCAIAIRWYDGTGRRKEMPHNAPCGRPGGKFGFGESLKSCYIQRRRCCRTHFMIFDKL